MKVVRGRQLEAEGNSAVTAVDWMGIILTVMLHKTGSMALGGLTRHH